MGALGISKRTAGQVNLGHIDSHSDYGVRARGPVVEPCWCMLTLLAAGMPQNPVRFGCAAHCDLHKHKKCLNSSCG